MSIMWPMHLDMTRDECKRVLRRFELEAYSSTISALRAQGELNDKKRQLLKDLASQLNISMERHKAEVRRAVNDERLTTIAEFMGGHHTATDWEIEGRRLIPLMPRLVPQTAFTALANNVANITAAENAKMPTPSTTTKKPDLVHDLPPSREPSVPEASRTPVEHTSSPPVPSATVSPVGSSFIVSEDEETVKKRRLSSSEDTRPPSPAQPPLKISPTTSISQQPRKSVAIPVNAAPVKVTPCRPTTASQASSTQKVIIVSTPANSASPSILQRSLSVPVVKTVTATSSSNTVTGQRAPSLIINNPAPSSSTSASNNVGNIVTISTNQGATGMISGKAVPVDVQTTAYITPNNSTSKTNPKSVMFPNKPRPRTSSIMIPMTRNQVPLSVTSVQRPILRAARPHLQAVKQDIAPFKLMPATYTSTKILPKPNPPTVSNDLTVFSVSTSSATVTTATTTVTTTLPVQSRTVPAGANARVISVNTPSIVAAPAAVSKQTGKSLPTVHVSALSPGVKTTTEKNVFLVQKSVPVSYSKAVPSSSGKETVGKLVLNKNFTTANVSSSSTLIAVPKPVSCKTVPAPNSQATLHLSGGPVQGNVVMIDLGKDKMSKDTLLADILHASGIFVDGSSSSDNTPESDDCARGVQLSIVEDSQSELSGEVVIATSNEVVICEETDNMDIHEGITAESPDEASQSRIVTLEEAVTLLGHSDSAETRALLRQAGIEVTDAVPTIDTSHSQDLLDHSIHRVVHEEDVVSAGQDCIMEMIGELDPQTGVYSIHSTITEVFKDDPTVQNVPLIQMAHIPSSASSSSVDIFSSALTSAVINLEPFQYMDGDCIDNQLKADVIEEVANKIPEPLTYSSSATVHVPVEIQQNQIIEGNSPEMVPEEEQVQLSSIMQPVHPRLLEAVTIEPNCIDASQIHLEDFTVQRIQTPEDME